MSPKLTVWYNTKCPVCNAGIEWQHSRLVRAARAGVIEFRDIDLEPDALSRFGAGIEDVRRRLHAVDEEGRLHVGADCAIAIWLRTPDDVWLGRVLRLPVIHQITRIGYDRFADLLSRLEPLEGALVGRWPDRSRRGRRAAVPFVHHRWRGSRVRGRWYRAV